MQGPPQFNEPTRTAGTFTVEEAYEFCSHVVGTDKSLVPADVPDPVDRFRAMDEKGFTMGHIRRSAEGVLLLHLLVDVHVSLGVHELCLSDSCSDSCSSSCSDP